jgi:hypothetical protein
MRGQISLIIIIIGWLAAVTVGQAEGVTDSLAAIRSVGPEGRGNAEAKAAWQELAAGDVTNLVAILAAMDGANDLAVNWLRAAVDGITGRALGSGGSLPMADLGNFLLDTSHSPRARRLDFEVLRSVDAATADKLLAGMLNDPSVEIRYDAVQEVIDHAGQSLAASNKAGAMLLFQQALRSARDVDQIDDISTNLDALGVRVDSLKLFAFLTDWKIIGPFDNTGRKGFQTVFAPEQEIDFAKQYDGKAGKVKWSDYVVTDKFGMVDMNAAYGKVKEVTAYAVADFVSDRAQPAEVRLGSGNSWKVWLNGKFLAGRDEYHFGLDIDQYQMPAQLQPGHNIILVKVCQNEQVEDWTVDWSFQLRVSDSLGTPILPTAVGKNASAMNQPQ